MASALDGRRAARIDVLGYLILHGCLSLQCFVNPLKVCSQEKPLGCRVHVFILVSYQWTLSTALLLVAPTMSSGERIWNTVTA
jgi:hypothetical protein